MTKRFFHQTGKGRRKRRLSVEAMTGGLLVLSVLIFNASVSVAQQAPDGIYGIGTQNITLIDRERTIEASGEFPGSDERRLDVIVWYPADDNGDPVEGETWPLLVYAHGTLGYPDNATHFVEYLVKRGYVVAAPTFPLTSSKSFTGVSSPGMFDTPNQPDDVSVVIDRLLADEAWGPMIDDNRIGCVGHSLGAITCYFSTYGVQTRDGRIDASAMIGAGDPVQAALASDFGFDGVAHAPVSVPALFLSGERDVFASLGGRPGAAYARIEPPKYEVMIEGGTHVWFRNGDETLPDGKNPDCLFFERNAPAISIPACRVRGELIDPALQQEITRHALLAFFDGYLKGKRQARDNLRQIETAFEEAAITFDEGS